MQKSFLMLNNIGRNLTNTHPFFSILYDGQNNMRKHSENCGKARAARPKLGSKNEKRECKRSIHNAEPEGNNLSLSQVEMKNKSRYHTYIYLEVSRLEHIGTYSSKHAQGAFFF